jgi:UDP-N-acetylglucosamine--dolichyl-phosphate N-acetylglucosaminephosphotransferase
MDDILGWKLGLKQWQKPLLCLFAALPVMMINIGQSSMLLPLIGEINLGILYPLLVVPLAISFAANGFNMLAGYNGLEAGMGIIILTTLGFLAWFSQGFPRVAMLAFVMVASLTAFLLYNKYPAKIFPGNTLTYTLGALIAIIAILSNTEKIALFLFIPYILEFLLKSRGNFKKESFAKPSNNSLDLPYKKIYGLEHLAIFLIKKLKRKAYEKDVVYTIISLEIFLAMFAILLTL